MRTNLAAILGIVSCMCFAASARADDFSVAALPGLQWWASAEDSQLAQNPNGTGTVVNGSPVGFISDLSGNGRNAVMGAAITSGGDSFRPVFQSDLVGFDPGILFNGSTAFMSLQRAFFNGTSSATIAIAVESDGIDDTKRYILGGGNASVGFANLAEPDAVFLQSNNQPAVVYGTGSATLDGSEVPEDTEILIARYQAGGQLNIWANGVLAGSMPISALGPSSAVAPTIPLLGDYNYATNATGLIAPSSTAGAFYFLEGMATDSALSNTQVTQLYNYLSEKWTGVQPIATSPNLYWNSTANPQETPATTIANPGHIEGVAAGNNQLFTFYTGVIAEYDSNWDLLKSNQAIGAGIYPAGSTVHSGDGDYAAGKIFAPLEMDLAGSGACIAVYDATQPGLPLITEKSVTSHPHEFSGLVVVPTAGTDGIIFGTSDFAAFGGSQLWMYNYADGNVLSPNFGSYLGTLQIPAGITSIQGVAWKAPYFYFSGTTLDRVLYQNGVLSSQAQVVWQTPLTVQGLTVEGSDILQVLQSGSTYETVKTLSSVGFTQINPTGFNAWNLDAGSNFGNNSAWNTSAPNAPGTAVLFGDGAGTWVHADSVQVSVDGAYTAGSLSFDTTAGTSYSLVGDGNPSHGITLDSGTGSGASVNAYSGNHSIAANLAIADTGGLTLDIVAGSTLTISGSISQVGGPRSLTLDDAGNLVLANTNSYTGGTTVRFGTLATTGNGSLGSGPLTVNASSGSASAVSISGAESVSALSGTVQQTGAASVTINPGASLTINQSSSTSFPGTVVNSGTFIKSGSGTLELDGAATLGSNSSLQVNGNGVLRFNIMTGSATIGSGATATISPGATLQLAGTVSAFSSGSNQADIINNGSTVRGGGLLVTGTNQATGAVTGTATTDANNATVYSGDTVVGDGTDPASLTATQILQNSLVINAGSTVTIAPSATAAAATDTAADTAAASATTGLTAGLATGAMTDSTPDAIASSTASAAASIEAISAIEIAVDSGSISATTGLRLENRVVAIDRRLSAIDPSLDASLLESRILAELPSFSVSPSTNSSLGATGLGLLNIDASEFASTSGGTTASVPITSLVDNPSGVPEPSTLLLAVVGGMSLTRAARRRTVARIANL